MNEIQSNPPQSLDEPYLAHPGETIHISFRIHPDDRQHLNHQLSLFFLIQPPPSQLATFSTGPNSKGEPALISDPIVDGNREGNEHAEQYWIAQHTKYPLIVPAILNASPDGTLDIVGTIPDPRNLVLRIGEPSDSEAIFPASYVLQPFQLSEQFAVPNPTPIAPDSQAAQAIANYRIRFDQLYQKRPTPPPPQTEYISDLKIAPPSAAVLNHS